MILDEASKSHLNIITSHSFGIDLRSRIGVSGVSYDNFSALTPHIIGFVVVKSILAKDQQNNDNYNHFRIWIFLLKGYVICFLYCTITNNINEGPIR